MAKSGKVKVRGALYELESGTVRWLSEEKVQTILQKAEADPARATEAMAAAEKSATAETGNGEGKANIEAAPASVSHEKEPAVKHY